MVSQVQILVAVVALLGALWMWWTKRGAPSPLQHEYKLVGAGPDGPYFSDPSLCEGCDAPERWYHSVEEEQRRKETGQVTPGRGSQAPTASLLQCKQKCDSDPACRAFNFYNNPWKSDGVRYENVRDGPTMCWTLNGDGIRRGVTSLVGNEMWSKVL